MPPERPESAARSRIDDLFDSLWADYTAFNPQAKRIYDLILERERKVDPSVRSLVNDHVALRTFDIPKVGVDALGAHFVALGYKPNGEYVFEEKKLFARHFEHADKSLPKVFISELQLGKVSPFVQNVAHDAIAALSDSDVKRPDFLWSRRKWKATHSTYQKLLGESEYAAWLYAFGYRSNHFTISFNHLKSFRDLEELNDFVRANGYQLNSSGGLIKGTPAQLLEQSSTLAEKTKLEFDDGAFEIPACYYEFARRYPKANGELYQGFIASSADKIFESTNVRQ